MPDLTRGARCGREPDGDVKWALGRKGVRGRPCNEGESALRLPRRARGGRHRGIIPGRMGELAHGLRGTTRGQANVAADRLGDR